MGTQNFTGQRDDSRNSFAGNGKLDAIQMATLDTTDAAMIYINSDIGQSAGEDARKRVHRRTARFVKDGGTDAGLLTLKTFVYDETNTILTGTETVTIGGIEYTATSGIITHTAIDLADMTVQGMLDTINAIPGFIAEIGDALTTTSLDADDVCVEVDADTVIPPIGSPALGILTNDVSVSNAVYKRIGLPTRTDRDPLQLLQVRGDIDVMTGGVVEVIRDDQAEYVSDGSHLETYESWVAVAAQTEYLSDNVLEGQTIRGPVVLKVSATSITGAAFSLKYRQALV